MDLRCPQRQDKDEIMVHSLETNQSLGAGKARKEQREEKASGKKP